MVSGVYVNFALEFQFQTSYAYWWRSLTEAYRFSATSLSKWPPGDHIGFFGLQTLTLVWPWISIPNLSGTILMYMCRSLLIFRNVNFKMAARWPYWIFLFPDSNFSLALKSTPNLSGTILIYIWVGAYWFSETSLSKWPPGIHIRYFGFWTLTLVWLWISTPNFNGTIFMYMGKSLLIFSDLII